MNYLKRTIEYLDAEAEKLRKLEELRNQGK